MNLEGVYHDLRKISPEKARSLLLRVLERNHKNISRTARIPLHLQKYRLQGPERPPR